MFMLILKTVNLLLFNDKTIINFLKCFNNLF